MVDRETARALALAQGLDVSFSAPVTATWLLVTTLRGY